MVTTGGADGMETHLKVEAVTPKHDMSKFNFPVPGLRASSFQMSKKAPEKFFHPLSSAGGAMDREL